jgi:hypothetical protein
MLRSERKPLRVVEHVIGFWSYHLAEEGKYEALCGSKVMMNTIIDLDRWGKTPPDYHIPEKWCKRCAALAVLREEEGR